jgi:hypothetical protein
VTDNPYRAPDAIVGDVKPAASTAPPRPRAVVVTLVLGWIFLALLVYALARFTANFVQYWSYLSHAGFAYLQIALRAALVLATSLMLVGLHYHWRIGRWLGSLFILSILVFLLVALLRAPTINANIYYKVGSYLGGSLILCGPVAWWFYAFTLSRKARTWFRWVPGPEAPR